MATRAPYCWESNLGVSVRQRYPMVTRHVMTYVFIALHCAPLSHALAPGDANDLLLRMTRFLHSSLYSTRGYCGKAHSCQDFWLPFRSRETGVVLSFHLCAFPPRTMNAGWPLDTPLPALRISTIRIVYSSRSKNNVWAPLYPEATCTAVISRTISSSNSRQIPSSPLQTAM